jgi:hypothetical protein
VTVAAIQIAQNSAFERVARAGYVRRPESIAQYCLQRLTVFKRKRLWHELIQGRFQRPGAAVGSPAAAAALSKRSS